jgi:hypothetical protein
MPAGQIPRRGSPPHVDAAADELGADRLEIDNDQVQTLN